MVDCMTWDYLMEYGSVEDLYWEAVLTLEGGHPIPVDVMQRLIANGYWLKEN